MSNKRVGLAERKTSRINMLFTPTGETAEKVSDKHTENTEAKKEAKKKTEAKKSGVFRQTYYMYPDVVEAVRIMDFETREGISNIINRILMENIPAETMKQARDNLSVR